MPPRAARRLLLTDLPDDVLAHIAARVPPATRPRLMLVNSAFARALRPPSLAWRNAALGPVAVGGLGALAGRMEQQGGAAARAPPPLERALVAAALTFTSVAVTAPVEGDAAAGAGLRTTAAAAAAAAGLALLLGSAVPPRPALSPALVSLRVTWRGSAEALVDSGALAAVFRAPTLKHVFLKVCHPPTGPFFDWRPRLAALAAAPVSAPLRSLHIAGEGTSYRQPLGVPVWMDVRVTVLDLLGPFVGRAGRVRRLKLEGFPGSLPEPYLSLQGVTKLAILDVGWVSLGGIPGDARHQLARSLRDLTLSTGVGLGRAPSHSFSMFLSACTRVTALEVVNDESTAWLTARGPPPSCLRMTALRSLTVRAGPTHSHAAYTQTWGANVKTSTLAALTALTKLAVNNTQVHKLDCRKPRGAPPGLPALHTLDLSGQRIPALPPLRSATAPHLRVLKLGWPDWGAERSTAADRAAERARGASLGRAGRAAAVRRPFDVSDLAFSTRPLPRTLEELEFRNASLDMRDTPAERDLQRQQLGHLPPPAAVAAAVARVMASHTAPNLRRLGLDNVSTSHPVVRELLAGDGAVLWAAYTPARGGGRVCLGNCIWTPTPPPPRP